MENTANTTPKPIAVYGESAFGGYALYAIEYGIDDRALISYYDSRPRWYKIDVTAAGRAFVRVFGRRIHLDNFLRV